MAQFLDHLHIVFHTLLDALRLDSIAYALEIILLFHQVVLNHADGTFLLLLRGDEEVCRIDLVDIERGEAMVGEGIHLLNAINLIIPPGNAQHVVAVSHVDVYGFALHSEVATLQVDVVSHVECIHQFSEELVSVNPLPLLNPDDVLLHRHRSAHTVDARNGRNHDDILSAREQSRDGTEAELIDLVVDGEVFLNVGVGGRQIGLRLIVVVVGDVIFHGVLGEESLHLLIELCGERLVVTQYQRRLSHVGDDVGNGEGFTRTGNAEEHLCRFALLDAFGELSDGLRLVARRLILRSNLEIHNLS